MDSGRKTEHFCFKKLTLSFNGGLGYGVVRVAADEEEKNVKLKKRREEREMSSLT